MAERNQEPKYEDVVEIMKKNIDKFESFYYASLSKQPERGTEGAKDGLYAALWGLREKVGLEGILRGLESEAISNINNGNGLTGNFNLTNFISNASETFIRSMFKLKASDVVNYIKKSRLKIYLIEEIDLIEEKEYKDKILGDLLESKNNNEKQYGNYLASRIENAVMAKMTPLAYNERVKRINEVYESQKASPKEKE